MLIILHWDAGEFVPRVEALKYESDRYVPAGERKQYAFGVGFRRKKGVIGCGIQENLTFFSVNF